MKLNQIRTRHFRTITLAASALLAASTTTAHTSDAIDPAYLLNSKVLAEQGIELRCNSPEFNTLKRNAQGLGLELTFLGEYESHQNCGKTPPLQSLYRHLASELLPKRVE